MRTRSITDEIVERAYAFVDRRGGSGIRRGGRARGSAQKKDPLLYGITGFSAANRLQTAIGGGEAGVDTGFGVVALAVWKEVPTGSQMLVQRVNGAVSAGWYLQTSGASLRAVFVSGAGVPVVSASYTIVASDLGRVIEIDASISGGMIWLIVNRQLVGAGVAITGYTPAASEDTVWSLWETTQAFTSGMLLSSATYRGNPSVAQRNAYADETRILGDLPTTIQGATITHRHSLRDQLRAIGGAVTSGQTAPATLEDTITRAAADALARQGTPTVVTIDTSRDGRRTLGVLGESGKYLQASGAAGRGATWSAMVWMTQRSAVSPRPLSRGARTLRGFRFFAASVLLSTGTGEVAIAAPAGLPDGSPCLVLAQYDGATLSITASNSAQTASVSAPTYVPPLESDALVVGFEGGAYSAGTVYHGMQVGDTLLTPTEIAAVMAEFNATGRMPLVTKGVNAWNLHADIEANGGAAAPASFADRKGAAAMSPVGGSMLVTSYVDRVWSYETTPIIEGASFDGDSSKYLVADTTMDVGLGVPRWYALSMRVDSQAVTSATRRLLGTLNTGGTLGSSIFTSGTNASVAWTLFQTNGAALTSPSCAIVAADIGKILLFLFSFDSTRARSYFKRAESGTGSSAASGTISDPPGPLYVGRTALTGGAAEGVTLFELACGDGLVSLAEFQALSDDCLAFDGQVRGIPNKTKHRWKFGVNGTVPVSVADLVGSMPLPRQGTIGVGQQFARAFHY